MKYVRLEGNIVEEIIPEYIDIFPNLPIEKRYPASFVNKLIKVEDDALVKPGMIYNRSTNEFTEQIVQAINISIEDKKLELIAESKILLSEWLKNNPILFNGEYYSVTEEKQSLLNNNLASYERAKSAGLEYTLKWNSTGNECVEWTYEDLVKLSLSIAEYVATILCSLF